jgi:cysteinyl-tRNA synthetase
MSKSLNNFFTLKTIFEKYDPRVVRYYLLTQHYSSPLNFSDARLDTAKNTLQGMDDAYLRLLSSSNRESSAKEITDKDLLDLQESFLQALDDDFNSEKALSYLHELKNIILKDLFATKPQRLTQLKNLYEDFAETSLGIPLPKQQNNNELQKLLKDRNEARKNKNWNESDKIRSIIDEKGYKIVDNKDGSSVLMKKI